MLASCTFINIMMIIIYVSLHLNGAAMNSDYCLLLSEAKNNALDLPFKIVPHIYILNSFELYIWNKNGDKEKK